jgi:carboxymethylenebutenolidase
VKKKPGEKANDAYDGIGDGLVDRRGFLKKLSIIAGSAAALGGLPSPFQRRNAMAAIIQEDDPRIITEDVIFQGATGDIKAKFSRPKNGGKMPGVVVASENRGLNAHIADVARRIALEGFQTLAPDALSPAGGTPADEAKAIALMGQLDKQSTVKNFVAAVKYLKTNPQSTGKVGIVGFCWGGAMANQVAVNSPDVAAAVPYYGWAPASEDVPKIKASLLLHYAGTDEMVNGGIPAFVEALKKAQVDYQLFMYEGAAHGFNNDTGARYHKAAAELAWSRTIAFFKEKLKT